MIIGLRRRPVAPWLLPCCGRMGSFVGCGLLMGSAGIFFFLEFCAVSVLSVVVHCWGVEFFLWAARLWRFFWLVVFRPVRSSVVSTHSNGRFGAGQGQRVLAPGMRDGL